MKNTTNWSATSKNPLNWSPGGQTALEDAVKLNSTTVALNSTIVTLLGYEENIHFFDKKSNTFWTKTTKNLSNWGQA